MCWDVPGVRFQVVTVARVSLVLFGGKEERPRLGVPMVGTGLFAVFACPLILPSAFPHPLVNGPSVVMNICETREGKRGQRAP